MTSDSERDRAHDEVSEIGVRWSLSCRTLGDRSVECFDTGEEFPCPLSDSGASQGSGEWVRSGANKDREEVALGRMLNDSAPENSTAGPSGAWIVRVGGDGGGDCLGISLIRSSAATDSFTDTRPVCDIEISGCAQRIQDKMEDKQQSTKMSKTMDLNWEI